MLKPPKVDRRTVRRPLRAVFVNVRVAASGRGNDGGRRPGAFCAADGAGDRSWRHAEAPPRAYSPGMDWKTLASTFGAIFVAELGDKTQLAALSMSAGSRAKWAVFAGSALALITTSAIAVLAGSGVTR